MDGGPVSDTTATLRATDDEAGRLRISQDATVEEVVEAVRQWIDAFVPAEWVEAGRRGGPSAVRTVRTRAQYETWYPTFGRSGLVAATWPRPYGGLDLSPALARRADEELRPFNLGRLNPLGLNLAAPALFAHGTEEQRRRFLPPIVRNEEVWCQLFSEPGAGSDLASRRRPVDHHGPEGVDHLGPPVGLGCAAGPDR
jgi:alkylation response protein AidB-like acyl-CoA dehydrogenase